MAIVKCGSCGGSGRKIMKAVTKDLKVHVLDLDCSVCSGVGSVVLDDPADKKS